MKRANVYLHDRLAGVLTEDESGFGFRYLDSYLDTDGAEVRSQTTLTGVQAKLSLDINRGGKNEPDRFTIVGLWGRYYR